MKEREQILIFGLVESAEKLGKAKGKFDRDDGKESRWYSWAGQRWLHSTYYTSSMGYVIAHFSDEFTSADGFKQLNYLDSYTRMNGDLHPLMDDYYKVIKQKENPLKTALKEISREQLSDVTLLMSKTSENPLLKPLQEVGIEVVKKKENSEIWFVLDGLDMNKAIGKEAIEADDKNAHHYSALHHIYNDWENLKKKVLFFEGNQRVHAPWGKNPELRNSRKQEKESQNKDQNPRALKDLIKAGERSPVSLPAKEQENRGTELPNKGHDSQTLKDLVKAGERSPIFPSAKKQEDRGTELPNKDRDSQTLKDLVKAGERSPVSPLAIKQESKGRFSSIRLSLKKRLESQNFDVKNDGIKTKAVHSR